MAAKKARVAKGPGFWATFRNAFAFGLGAFAASLVFVAAGISLFLGGFVLRNKEQKKPEEEQERWKVNAGLGMMVVGVIIAGGAGLSGLIGEVSEEF